MAGNQPTNLDLEEWLPVIGYEGTYQVSTLGRVKSCERTARVANGNRRVRERILKPSRHKGGHLKVGLYRDGKQKSVWVHRLVLEAFVGLAKSGEECCHSNGIPDDNRLGNLRWDSVKENQIDRIRHGTHYQSNKALCPRGHLLESPNLVRSAERNGWRYCLACHRARGIIRYDPSRGDLETISDSYYEKIMAVSAITIYKGPVRNRQENTGPAA